MKLTKRLLFAPILAILFASWGSVTSMAASTPHPLAPVGFHAQPADLTLIKDEFIMVAGERVEHQVYGVNHKALPAGTKWGDATGIAFADAAYWYWAYTDTLCGWGCIGPTWRFDLFMDGVANGTNVWKWDVGCTPGGIGASITWCGYLYNGGGWPYYAMQFGLNGQVCVPQGCGNHGIRQWIDDSGNRAGYSYW